jgi:hypothetical protein
MPVKKLETRSYGLQGFGTGRAVESVAELSFSPATDRQTALLKDSIDADIKFDWSP